MGYKRKLQIGIPVNKKEKKLIKTNAGLHNYKSVAAFLRDKGLETDISNKASLAIMLTYLSSHMKNLSPDAALDWTKQKNNIKNKFRVELAGMPKEKRELYLEKLESTLENTKAIKEELEGILSGRFIE